MSAVICETVMVAAQETLPSSSPPSSTTAQTEIESAKCDCCGLTEDCTSGYIEWIRERYAGKWICSLCAEAMNNEIIKSERLISTEEALSRHLNVCGMFRCSLTLETDPAVHLISAFRQILRRSLECPRGLRSSTPGSPIRGGSAGDEKVLEGASLVRSESCFPTTPSS